MKTRSRTRASIADLHRAADHLTDEQLGEAIGKLLDDRLITAELFDALWDQLSPEERAILADRVAQADTIDDGCPNHDFDTDDLDTL